MFDVCKGNNLEVTNCNSIIQKLNDISNKGEINDNDEELIDNEFYYRFNEELEYTVSSNLKEINEKTVRSQLTQLIIKKWKFEEIIQVRRGSSNKRIAMSQISNWCVFCT